MDFINSKLNGAYKTASSWSTSTKVAIVVGLATAYGAYNYLYSGSNPYNNYCKIDNGLISNLKYVGKHSSEINLNEFKDVVNEMKLCFQSNITKNVFERKKQLNNLVKLLTENKNLIIDALKQDLGRPPLLSLLSASTSQIKTLLKNIDKWTKPKNISTLLSSDCIISEPYGTVYINGIWNFPISLAISQIGAAIVAGNNVIFKACNTAPKSSELLCDLLHKYIDSKFVQCLGHPSIAAGDDRIITSKILCNKFDLIFFTGSTNGGKYIMKEAAKTLTPCILELGGKNAVIIDDTADISRAARSVISFRVMNCGQICLSPDYVLIYKNVLNEFIQECKKYAKQWYKMGDDAVNDLGVNQSKFVSKQQYLRCVNLLKTTKGSIVYGGKYNENELMFEPTIVLLDNINDINHTETFGPILWIIPINNDITEAVNYINSKPKSLTMSMFSNNSQNINILKYNTSSGGLSINSIASYMQNKNAPFGGVGASGMGSYHGKFSFDAFSHKKPVSKSYFEMKIIYPPYKGRFKEWLFNQI